MLPTVESMFTRWLYMYQLMYFTCDYAIIENYRKLLKLPLIVFGIFNLNVFIIFIKPYNMKSEDIKKILT